MDYNTVYQKRKTIGIYITNDARIEVRCPYGTPKSDIDAFVEKSSEWIENALERKRRLISERAAFEITDKARLAGRIYPIKYIPEQKCGFNNEYFYLPEGISDYGRRESLILIYKTIAKRTIIKRAREIAATTGQTPSKISITSAKTRWGSCSGKNSINFSWRLIMASPKAVDYVIIHELAHITEHNHSKRFWALVEKLMPDYKTAEKELAALAEILSRENW